MNIAWNAEEYNERFQFVHQYGEDLFSWLDLTPGMSVVDLGCGNGALTERLAAMGAEVLGLDASPEMLAVAQRHHPRLRFERADAASFIVERPVDAVFSNAVFHWIDDQDALLSSVSQALKPGGQLVCEFGGAGCAETVHHALRTAFARRGLPYRFRFYFPTVGEYAPLLEAHRLKVVRASLFDRFTEQVGEDGLADWIRMFVTLPFEGLSDSRRAEIIREAVEACRPSLFVNGKWHVDYVRIRIKAIRVAGPLEAAKEKIR